MNEKEYKGYFEIEKYRIYHPIRKEYVYFNDIDIADLYGTFLSCLTSRNVAVLYWNSTDNIDYVKHNYNKGERL
jgi:hypothetical protein